MEEARELAKTLAVVLRVHLKNMGIVAIEIPVKVGGAESLPLPK